MSPYRIIFFIYRMTLYKGSHLWWSLPDDPDFL